MDDSMSSTTNYMRTTKFFSSNSIPENSSESGWTLYLEDFISNKMDYEDNNNFLSSDHQTSSMVSDAAFGDNDDHDDELKDTATSTAAAHQCPNFNDLKHMCMKSKEQDNGFVSQAYNSNYHLQNEQIDKKCNSTIYKEKGHNAPQQAEEGIDMDSLETKLRRKGLCLVPMSLLVNYLK